jgi:N,N'-diacetyllegionaminate synthase
MSVYIIAEIGPNHNGSLLMALDMIGQLAQVGVDAIKFQLAVPENVYSKDAFKADYQATNDGPGNAIEMSRRIQLSFADHEKLYAACKAAGVAYMCTAFDLESLEFIDATFEMPYFKIASGELLSADMLSFMAQRRRPVLLSTGMATFAEVGWALGVLSEDGLADITLLHCVSNYPAPHGDINLRVMDELSRRFDRPVGYSDHSLGPECCLAAVAMGAVVIEKHVTLDRDLPGPDHKASATIDDFRALVRSIRTIESALGAPDKIFSQAENGIRRMARKSAVALRDLKAGHILAFEDICFKRPGTGISPRDLPNFIGKTLRCGIDADRVISDEDLI